ncbi:class I fructose-bisphosphate aldolase family protein [bacterium]|nr:class I fructose-bisphosphate aldolase family protein [bacterium]
MLGIGKNIRLERIIDRNTGKTVIVPMDHGVTMGPIKGIVDMRDMVNEIAEGGANAVLGHIGLPLHGHRRHGRDIGLILHLSGSTVWAPDPNAKVLVNTVEMALKIGADAVSVHINIGAESESEMLKDLGQVSVTCHEWGMPLLAMMYTRGEKFSDKLPVEGIRHAARIAAELGADIVKISYPGSKDAFEEVVKGCPIPIVIAGGEKAEDDRQVFQIIKDSMIAGGAGVSIGRNAFQHEKKIAMVRAICGIVHEGISVDKAIEILNA